jgi:hypothetical protein
VKKVFGLVERETFASKCMNEENCCGDKIDVHKGKD